MGVGLRPIEKSVDLPPNPKVARVAFLSRLRDRGATEGMAEILWHRRETRRQTEKTNFSL